MGVFHPDGGFRTEPVPWAELTAAREPGSGGTSALSRPDPDHADLACSAQLVIEEVLLDLVYWLRNRTDAASLCMAGGVALNCVANSRIWSHGGFDDIWVQPAAGDAGTALGAALSLAAEAGESITAMPTARLGRGWSDDEIAAILTRPPCATSARTASPTPSVMHWPTTTWSAGSRAGRVRATGTGRPVPAGRSSRHRQSGAAQHRQGPRTVPPGRTDGAG